MSSESSDSQPAQLTGSESHDQEEMKQFAEMVSVLLNNLVRFQELHLVDQS
jgi:hypothetical protein